MAQYRPTFCLKVFLLIENYIILHYVLDFKYIDQSSFTRVFVTTMSTSVMKWRVEIGMFNPINKTRFIK